MAPPIRILIINPNSSTTVTDSLKPIVHSLNHLNITPTFFTAPPPSPPSINSPSSAHLSATISLPHLLPLLPHHDAFLLACYSAHPLIPLLRTHLHSHPTTTTTPPVLGIHEATLATSLLLLPSPGTETFGIISTGVVWKELLEDATRDFLGGGSEKFAGVETMGLSCGELEGAERGEVRERVRGAVRRLVGGGGGQGRKGRVSVICLGCAGMVGMEGWVREAVGEMEDEEGGEGGRRGVRVVDGVKVGVGMLVALVSGGC